MIGGGGAGPKTLKMVAYHCDGWMSILGNLGWPEIKAGIARLQSGEIRANLPADAIEYSIFCWAPPDKATLADMQDQGVSKIIISLEAHSRDTSLNLMDDYAQLVD